MDNRDDSAPREKLGHYELLECLGEGGMGVVYKARDSHLERFVALKTLRAEFVTYSERRSRFIQEAKSASALNHPNIVHVYDISREGGRDFIAMEYVEGIGLNDWVRVKRPSLRELLDCAVQIADGLEAAHRVGIIHRDLKPANIMICGSSASRPGLVKILDFGLAKLTEPESLDPEDMETFTMGSAKSFDSIVGTPGYMSPEQISGMHVDHRTDIFSFGAVLYYMATAKPAFRGGTSGLLMAAILRDEPPAPRTVSTDVHPALEEIIAQCMKKDPGSRYQKMADVKIALEDLRDGGAVSGLHSRPSGIYPIAKPASRWTTLAFRFAMGLVLLLAGAAAGRWLWNNVGSKPEPILKRLTTDSGLSTDPVISRDGSLIAYASDRAGEGSLDIWVRQTAGGDPVRITRDPADDYEPDLSPDGTAVAFRSERDGGAIFVAPTLGGQERRLADGGRSPRFSPNGKQIAYWTGGPMRPVPFRPRSAGIFVIDTGGGKPRQVLPDFAVATRPMWTEDGAHLIFWGAKQAQGDPKPGWWAVSLSGGSAVEITAPEDTPDLFERSEPTGWHNDKIVFTTVQEDKLSYIYEASFSTKDWRLTEKPHRLTLGTTGEESPSIAADGRVAFAAITPNLDVYSASFDTNRGEGAAPARLGSEGRPNLERLTRDMADDSDPVLSPDGATLVFQTLRSGQWEIWKKNLQDGTEKVLTRGEDPIISPDGKLVALFKDSHLFFIPLEGGTINEVSANRLAPAAWSPDLSKILAADYWGKKTSIQVLDVSTGQLTNYLVNQHTLFPRAFSPDGHWIAFTEVLEDGRQILRVAPFRPSDPPKESEWTSISDATTTDYSPRWSPNGAFLYFISERDGFACVWAVRMDPKTQQPHGAPFAVAHLHGAALRMRPGVRWLSLSKDRLVFCLEERSGSIWMLQDRN